jgi:hypothetical protein
MGNLGLIWLTTARTPGSHHLPPYSILYVSLLHLHPNGTFSRDSQSGVSKLSQFRLPGLWVFITSHPKLGLGRGLKQSCNSPQELSNGVSHFTCMHRDRVDSRLLMVGSQTTSLTLALLSTITCAANVQMVHARPFWTSTLQDLFKGIKNTSMQGVLTPAIVLWVFEVPEDSQVPFSRVWMATSHFFQSGVATLILGC